MADCRGQREPLDTAVELGELGSRDDAVASSSGRMAGADVDARGECEVSCLLLDGRHIVAHDVA